MSKLYTEISKYYDYIFPVGDAQLNLIKELAGQPPRDILDVACGSGGYSKKLSEDGYVVTAIDLDEAMILMLKESGYKIDTRVMNMLDIESLDKKFDLLFCIGNSLVHLKDADEILQFLKSCRNCLKPEGRLLIQIINYDRILAKDVKSLPTIKNDKHNIEFERYYSYLPDKNMVDFKTILRTGDGELENHQMLYPARSEELKDLLNKAGFDNPQFFGSFKKDTYVPMESYALVIVA